MEPKVQLANNGQAVNHDDFNAIGRQAALNAEYVWAQLARLAPTGAGSSFTPVRGIIPSGGQAGLYSEFHRKGLLGASGSSDAKVMVQPFVAVIGSRADQSAEPTTLHDIATDGVRDALREIRLAPHYGQVDKSFQTEKQIPASAGNNRWDLIYAKVDIDVPQPELARFVKTGDTPVVSQDVVVTSRTTVSIELLSGTEATNPTKPTLPADGGGSYHIALGYYFVGSTHTLTSAITASRLHEVFTPILVSPANGGVRAQPANRAYNNSGYAWAIEGWDNSRGRPATHLSPNMVGIEKRTIAIDAYDGGGFASASPNAVTILDDSVDWRKRLFTTIVEAAPSGGGDSFPWYGASGANLFSSFYSTSTFLKAGQSFQTNTSVVSGGAAVGGLVVALDDTSSPSLAVGALILIFVDAATGNLCVWRNNVDADRRVLLIVEATGRYANSDALGV